MHLDEPADRVHHDLVAHIGTVLQPEMEMVHDVRPWQGVAHGYGGRYDLAVLREVHQMAAIATGAYIQSDSKTHNIGGKSPKGYLLLGQAIKSI